MATERDAIGWAYLGQEQAKLALRHFTLAQRLDEPVARAKRLREARSALELAAYYARKGERESVGQEEHERRHRLDIKLSEPLTRREWEIAQILGEGLSNIEIADRLGVGEGTIKTHVGHIIFKLGVRTRVEAAIWAILNSPQTPADTP